MSKEKTAKTEVENKEDIRNSESSRSYYQNIRQKFANKRQQFINNDFDINFTSLKKHLKDEYGIDPNERTLASLFKCSDTAPINMALAVAVCNIFGFDLKEMIQFDNHTEKLCHTPIMSSPLLKRLKGKQNNIYENIASKQISYLDSDFYCGEYFCYSFNQRPFNISISEGKNQPTVSWIRDAKLKIYKKYGETLAEFTEITTISNNPFTYRGRVISLNNIGKVYIFLATTEGNSFKWLLFDNIPLRKRELYYKEIGCLTHTNTSTTLPLFQKMILTKEPMNLEDKEQEKLLRGALTFNPTEILISSSNTKKFLSEYEDLKRLFVDSEPFYKLSYYDILFNNKLNWSYNRRAAALLKLMQYSHNNAQVVIDQEENMHTFF